MVTAALNADHAIVLKMVKISRLQVISILVIDLCSAYQDLIETSGGEQDHVITD